MTPRLPRTRRSPTISPRPAAIARRSCPRPSASTPAGPTSRRRDQAARVATAERALARSRAGRHRRFGLEGPAAPDEEEKTGYADRNLALIIIPSLASFGALLLSQTRFVFVNPIFTWIFLPFLTFT